MHSQLPEAIYSPSGFVLYDMLYNIGGYSSTHSVLWYRLTGNSENVWNIAQIPGFNFKGYPHRMAYVIDNKIIYFGSSSSKSTFVLEKEEVSE